MLPNWREAARVLAARGLIECYQAVAGDPPAAADSGTAAAAAADPDTPPSLSDAQRDAVTRIDATAGSFAAFVLQGATGSGKTEVYLQCAARALERGSSVLMLVPEIALTPQLVGRFRRRLPVPMAVLHSALSDAERLAAWRSARAGRARIVLGTRSAVFAPLPQLGLIVVDEEHDSSYKQHDGGCRYSARDLSVVRAQQAAGAGSARLGHAGIRDAAQHLRSAATSGCCCRGAPDQAAGTAIGAGGSARARRAPGPVDSRSSRRCAGIWRHRRRYWCSSIGAVTRPRCCAPPAAGSRPAASAMRA